LNTLVWPGGLVGEELVALGMPPPVGADRPGRGPAPLADAAVDDGQVERPVLVEIPQHRAEPGAAPGRPRQARLRRLVPKVAARSLPPEGVGLLGQVSDKHAEPADVLAFLRSLR
jgi:hypothetical protein